MRIRLSLPGDSEALYSGTRANGDFTEMPAEAISFSDYLQVLDQSIVHVAELEGLIIGHAALSRLDMANRSAAFGVVIYDQEDREKGYAKALQDASLEAGFRRMQLHRIYAWVSDFNERALSCSRMSGWKREGVARDARWIEGVWRDYYLIAILAPDWEKANVARQGR